MVEERIAVALRLIASCWRRGRRPIGPRAGGRSARSRLCRHAHTQPAPATSAGHGLSDAAAFRAGKRFRGPGAGRRVDGGRTDCPSAGSWL